MKPIYSVMVIICMVVLSCSNDRFSTYNTINPTLIDSVSGWGDSVFLSSFIMRAISTSQKNCIVTDMKNNRIIVLDSNLNYERVIGRAGKGPGEYLTPWENLLYDNTPVIFDHDNKKLSYVSIGGKLIHEINLNIELPKTRFAIDPSRNVSYFSTPSDKKGVTGISYEGQIVSSFGKSTENGQGARHLMFSEKNELISLGSVIPVIERYTPEGNLIDSYDFSLHPLITPMLNHINTIFTTGNYNWSRFYVNMFLDACYSNGKVYALLMKHIPGTHNEDIIGNEVLVFDIGEKVLLTEIIKLEPENSPEHYMSISVFPDGKRMVAFKETSGQLCLFNLNN